MTDLTPTFTFEGDEVFAIHEGKVIASGTDMEQVESDAVKYLESLKVERDNAKKAHAQRTATHIITPNGLKGEILGRTPTVWGEVVTARFKNGEIQPVQIRGEEQWVNERIASVKGDPSQKLAKRLEADFEHDRESLAKRHGELREIAIEAHRLITAGAPYNIEVKLDQIKVAAEHEARQVKEAVDHLDAADAEAFAPPKPQYQVAEQADIGHSGGNDWLDVVAQDMVAESEGQDFDKLLNEEPALFVTELDNGALADTGVTREMALSHIVAKTAGFTGDEIEDFRQKFVARVEVARRGELASRKTAQKKEAAVEHEAQTNAPDEALFM